MSIDLDSIKALDIHVHVEKDDHGHISVNDDILAASEKYFRADVNRTPTVDDIAAYYRERSMAAVVFTVDATTAMRHEALSSEEIADQVAKYDDTLIAFGSVDPLQGDKAIEQAIKLVNDHGVRGFKFHPGMQDFYPNDERFYPLFAEIDKLGVPIISHTGQTGIGAGMPGGAGIKLRPCNPMYLDDLAADFPTLQIIMAHPSVPWQSEAISIATHKANTYIDLSGWSPKYFAPELVRAANTMLRHKVLFGTDYPVIDPDKWVTEFEKLDMKPEVLPLVLKQNAAKLLGLT
ncbi:amidohydrolase family protein [Cumulibacter manganitolerans]|uniref:amidohydrolase family protein n=1 Tax=Cumulibacter manganitolerans TaxID=1884992 RepID=UPI00129647D3|nr:amidohydrolase family protein [Cumulibacter manganitolerans]